MTIDIFEYELKYKKQPEIVALIEEFKALELEASENESVYADQSDAVKSASSQIRRLEEEAERAHDDITKLITRLEQCRAFDKPEIVETINDVIMELEGIADD